MGTPEQSQKITGNKGTCKLGEHENIVEIFVGNNGTKENFSREHRPLSPPLGTLAIPLIKINQ
jgi:hypothetical protein